MGYFDKSTIVYYKNLILKGTLTVGGEQITPGLVKTKKVSLSDAQILSLNSSPTELIANPNSDIISLVDVAAIGSGGYTHSDDIYIGNFDPSLGNISKSLFYSGSGIITSGEEAFFNRNVNTTTNLWINRLHGIFIMSDTDPTGGPGTLDIYITYAIIDV